MKQTALKFKIKHGVEQAQQDGALYRICMIRFTDVWGRTAIDESRNYFVEVSATGKLPATFSTYRHKAFNYEEALSFCQQIADGEIDIDELQSQYDAEDMEAERAAIRAAVQRAQAFRTMLAKRGLGYADFLQLEAECHELGELGHRLLLGYDNGEGWPDV